MPSHVSPTLSVGAYTCPLCNTFAQQVHFDVLVVQPGGDDRFRKPLLAVTTCMACGEDSIWRSHTRDADAVLVWPASSVGPEPHAEMPEDVAAIYREAGDVRARSPRAAAALLRLALQVLLQELVPGEDNINRAIGTLVKRGLDADVQRAMDVMRVIGNNAVHPGQVQLGEDDTLVPALFELLNRIVADVIARPRRTAELFDLLPEGAREAIDRRDAASRPTT